MGEAELEAHLLGPVSPKRLVQYIQALKAEGIHVRHLRVGNVEVTVGEAPLDESAYEEALKQAEDASDGKTDDDYEFSHTNVRPDDERWDDAKRKLAEARKQRQADRTWTGG